MRVLSQLVGVMLLGCGPGIQIGVLHQLREVNGGGGKGIYWLVTGEDNPHRLASVKLLQD